ncbi:MAG TPA: hypothetical protein VEC36_09085 [Patescibacteria group bacterium]|nr:hypothetical protein [Patescibacteria group bacterium]
MTFLFKKLCFLKETFYIFIFAIVSAAWQSRILLTQQPVFEIATSEDLLAMTA